MKSTRFLVIVNMWCKALGICDENYSSVYYKVYRIVITFYFIISIVREIVQLVIVARNNHEEINKNMGITLLTIVTFFKFIATRKEKMKAVLKRTAEAETLILNTQNIKVLNLYNSYVKKTHFVCYFCYIGGAIVIAADVIYAILSRSSAQFNTTTGCTKKPVLVSSWVPFDKDCYYVVGYLIQSLDAFFGGIYTTGIDSMFLSPIIFSICCLEILQTELEEVSSPQDLKKVVKSHQFIIK